MTDREAEKLYKGKNNNDIEDKEKLWTEIEKAIDTNREEQKIIKAPVKRKSFYKRLIPIAACIAIVGVAGNAVLRSDLIKTKGNKTIISENYSDKLKNEAYAVNEDNTETNIMPSGDFDGNIKENSGTLKNNYMYTSEQPLSTFSIDVDTASYTYTRKMLRNYGVDYLDSGCIRTEEFINYFNYDYENPTGDAPFSINTEYSTCPWNDNKRLVMIGLQGKKVETKSEKNLVFLVDVSGSMSSKDKLPLVCQSILMLSENLAENDTVSIVTYASNERVVLDGAKGNDYKSIKAAVDELCASGNTNGEAGIKKAYELAEKHFIKGGNNRIIIATDGDLNVGISSTEELIKLVEQKRESGVYLSVLGFGSGNYQDAKLEAIADNGNGNYSYIDSVDEAKKVLVDEIDSTLITIAKDVKIQIEFNSEYVKGYRLIGYENRVLANEDFDNDEKDAGEIGAGHTVTAIYEIDLTDNADSKDSVLNIAVRYKDPDKTESKLIEKNISAKDYNEKMSKNLSFASAVAEFAAILKNDTDFGKISYFNVLQLAENSDYESDHAKKDFINLVKELNKNKY